jgi:hypothetical protein
VTNDQVPAKGLWGDKKPPNLIEVPSCRSCNIGASDDDEYFRLAMLMPADASPGTGAAAALDVVMRSFTYEAKRGFKRATIKSIEETEIVALDGRVVKAGLFTADLARLRRAVARYTRGLYYHVTGTRLPADCGIQVWAAPDLVDIDPSSRQHSDVSSGGWQVPQSIALAATSSPIGISSFPSGPGFRSGC